MRRKDLPHGTPIDIRDRTSRIFVWLISGKTKTLYGIKRLCEEHNIATSTFWEKWKSAGRPKEIVLRDIVPSAYEPVKKGYTVDGEWFPSLLSISKRFRVSENTLSARFKKFGRKNASSDELTSRKPYPQRENKQEDQLLILCPDGKKYTIGELAQQTGLNIQTITKRAVKKSFVFDHQDLQRNDKSRASCDELKPVDPIYMSPRYRDIPLGDLCHLSSKGKNTGAGKGEIPDEEWIGRIGKISAIRPEAHYLSFTQ